MRDLMVLAKAGAIACCLLAATPLLAQKLPEGTPHQQEVAAAASAGDMLYAYDQAAWHGTDRFQEDLEAHGDYDISWLRGFLVFPGKEGQLQAIFYGEEDGEMLVGARYSLEGSNVIDGGLFEEDERIPLAPDAIRMAQARDAAFAAMVDEQYGLCARSNPNTVVFPPDANGEITVYVLTPQIDNGSYPLGGHYRFTIGTDGAVRASRRFLNSCFSVPIGGQAGAPDGSRALGMFITHLLDEYPTEVHFFASRYVPVSLFVGTMENDLMWSISNGVLQGVEDIPARGRD